jgi:hypothetical protein
MLSRFFRAYFGYEREKCATSIKRLEPREVAAEFSGGRTCPRHNACPSVPL